MRKTIVDCDRCGKDAMKIGRAEVEIHYPGETKRYMKNLDLCPNCSRWFREWMKSDERKGVLMASDVSTGRAGE